MQRAKKLSWYKLNLFSERINITMPAEKMGQVLDCLTMDQKIALIILIYSEKLTKKAKILLLNILDNLLNGSTFQNKIVLEILYFRLGEKNIQLLYLLDNLKLKNRLFEQIIQKIGLANIHWGELLKEILEEDFHELNY
jgi:hypothetical protein